MAYGRKTRGKYNRKNTTRRSYNKSYSRKSAPRRRKTSRGSQTIRIVLEQANPTMSDPMATASRQPVLTHKARKARF